MFEVRWPLPTSGLRAGGVFALGDFGKPFGTEPLPPSCFPPRYMNCHQPHNLNHATSVNLLFVFIFSATQNLFCDAARNPVSRVSLCRIRQVRIQRRHNQRLFKHPRQLRSPPAALLTRKPTRSLPPSIMQPNTGFGHLDSLVDEIQKKQSDHVKVYNVRVSKPLSVSPKRTRKASTFGSHPSLLPASKLEKCRRTALLL